MKILFVARHFTYFRNFESVIRELAARGHRLHLAADREEQLGGRALVDRLAADLAGVTVGFTPARADARLFELATALRLSADYFRYLDPAYADAPAIRARAWERTPRLALALAHRPLRFVAAPMLRALEHALPIDDAVLAFVRDERPDVVLLTPLIELGSPQLDYLKAARTLGIPTALCVWSWDHLTSKSLIRVLPDKVFVWNETQRGEAIDLHGLPPERIVVTGAQCFDQWFDRAPSRGRVEFCRDVGLPDDRPFVLYVCSALFRGSPSEAAFVRRWLEAVRCSPVPALRDAAVLVRPHPQRLAEWDGVTLDDLGPVAIHGGNPVDAGSRADYFDSLYYAATVVGLNTSAMVEAAILDHPVHTLLLPEFRANQEGTLHFRHLANGPHAFLRIARSLDEHVEQLAAAVRGEHEPRNRVFVDHFIRPHGVATTAFAQAVEHTAARPHPPTPASTTLLRPIVSGLYALAGTTWGARLLDDPVAARERAGRDGRIAEKRALADVHRRRREQKEEDKRRRWRHKRRQESLVRLKTAAKRLIGQH